ncbi:DnaT-like ssDNA-binding protein [Snodgrassella alvi]|jgi:hypothetical protein|uniref:DnaT-like ssDNA-binding protein n=1 Tax=Snodgrassella alvi TaxID=1196083 RepID=UPI000C1EAC7C|nr:DnaT-like ssDNA-binding protein [Snodgrassella alvi]PIT48537.1 hypothetical protein BHC51_04645 [Snodgrassella alvi]
MIIVPRDSYVSVEQADAYHAIRSSKDVWEELETSQKEMRLVSASDYVDACYQLRQNLNRKMRAGEVGIIEPVYKAVCELALRTGLFDNDEQKRKSVKVGEISVTYAGNGGSRFEYIDALLLPYTAGTFAQIPIIRG